MGKHIKSNQAKALVLIILGIFFFISRMVDSEFVSIVFVFLLGIMFLGLGFYRKKTSLFIPSGIMLGLGAGFIAINNVPPSLHGEAGGGFFLIFFSTGWFFITLMALTRKEKLLWPLIPGVILALVGAGLLSGGIMLRLLSWMNLVWPLALVAVGVWIWFRKSPESGNKAEKEKPAGSDENAE